MSVGHPALRIAPVSRVRFVSMGRSGECGVPGLPTMVRVCCASLEGSPQ